MTRIYFGGKKMDEEKIYKLLDKIEITENNKDKLDEIRQLIQDKNYIEALNEINELSSGDYKTKSDTQENEEFDEDKKALDYIIQAIDRLVVEDSMYLLGDLYHTKGYILRKLGHLQEAKKSNQLALSIFEIQNNNKFKTMTQLEIEEINHLLQKVIPIDYYK